MTSTDPMVQYVSRWRLEEAVRRLMATPNCGIDHDSAVIIACAGEGMEGTVLCDLGFRNVTVTDITDSGVRAALLRDPRLKGQVANAESLPFENEAFDLAVVQDGLHHLSSPVRGFTEMLRVSKRAVFFLEPHDSLVGNLIGTKWERNDGAVNYVFRWNRRLVGEVTSSYLGHAGFRNQSFSFWHHNPVLARFGAAIGGGAFAIGALKCIKATFDALAGRWGNQFCGMIVKSAPPP
ncbi:MAG: methyltransferase domain-containing protein [Betaproteobacteria bacterium]